MEHEEIRRVFGNTLRLRVSGICIEGESILLVKHKALGEKGILWAPPGGGLQWGETVGETLEREFLEETGLEVKMGLPLLINEYLEDPLHAIELFFEAEKIGGSLVKGIDPELGAGNQIIQEVRFVPFDEIRNSDPSLYHSLFRKFTTRSDFVHFLGFYQNIVFKG